MPSLCHSHCLKHDYYNLPGRFWILFILFLYISITFFILKKPYKIEKWLHTLESKQEIVSSKGFGGHILMVFDRQPHPSSLLWGDIWLTTNITPLVIWKTKRSNHDLLLGQDILYSLSCRRTVWILFILNPYFLLFSTTGNINSETPIFFLFLWIHLEIFHSSVFSFHEMIDMSFYSWDIFLFS